MKKLTLTLLGASLLAGSLFAAENRTMDMDNEKIVEIHKSIHEKMHTETTSKDLTPSEKALQYIQNKYGEQDDVREYNN